VGSSPINLAGLFSGASSGLLDIVKQLQKAQADANAANEKRYQDILGMYGSLGQAGETRIAKGEQQAQAKSTQDLTNRGLGNTTITGAMSRGISSDAETARQQLGEGITRDKAGVMERRTDQGPDMGMYGNLLMQASKAQTAAKPAVPAATGGKTMAPLGSGARLSSSGGGGSFGSGGSSSGGRSGGGGVAPVPGQMVRGTDPLNASDFGASTASAVGAGDSTGFTGGNAADGQVATINGQKMMTVGGRWQPYDASMLASLKKQQYEDAWDRGEVD
jgi:hypothetical protein